MKFDINGSHIKSSLDISKMSLKNVMEATKYMSINDGGLRLMIEKIVMEIEEIKLKIGD